MWGDFGHRLASLDTSNDEPLVICMACGSWACREPVLLLAPCGKVRSDAGQRALSRVLKGLHPNHVIKGVSVTGLVVLRPQELRTADHEIMAIGASGCTPASGGDARVHRPPGAEVACSQVGASPCSASCGPAVQAVLQRVLARAAAREARECTD